MLDTPTRAKMFQHTAYSSAKLSESQEPVTAFQNLANLPENQPTHERFAMQDGRSVSQGHMTYYGGLMKSCSSHGIQFSQLQSIE
jgi:hypothetical protein